MRSQVAHDYKFITGLLNWYFGDQVTVGYQYDSDPGVHKIPSVLVDDVVIYEGKIPANDLVKHLMNLGATRLDLGEK